ncbi:hypothetical protein PMAYCL1PPCAC_10981, partial [Pristionchus mayeri]
TMRALLFVTIALLAAGARADEAGDKQKKEQLGACNQSMLAIVSWNAMGLGAIIFLNGAIIFIIVWTLLAIKRIPSECEKLTSSVQWLNRTAVRTALGPSAKQTLSDYAKTLPELVGLTGEKNIEKKD